MKKLLISLKAEMAEEAENAEKLKGLRAAFEKDNAALVDMVKANRSIIEGLKDAIMPLALEEYKTSGEKQLIGGVGIKVLKDKEIYTYEPADALAFAKEKDMFLALDKKAFDAAAPGLTEDFITKNIQPGAVTVTFPKEVKIDE